MYNWRADSFYCKDYLSVFCVIAVELSANLVCEFLSIFLAMRRLFILDIMTTLMMSMLLISCVQNKKHGDDPDAPNQEYPSTANVIRNAVKDYDGNSYDAVQIGEQVWMAQNLRTTHYADGTEIPLGTTWSYDVAYRYAPGTKRKNEKNMDNVPTYGYLYNWPAVMHAYKYSDSNPSGVRGICPEGWHVPSDAEWIQLEDYMKTQPIYFADGDSTHLAKALAANCGWRYCDVKDTPGKTLNTNNATGFSAMPAGFYTDHTINFGEDAFFWTASILGNSPSILGSYSVIYRGMFVASFAMPLKGSNEKFVGGSVRCVRD